MYLLAKPTSVQKYDINQALFQKKKQE